MLEFHAGLRSEEQVGRVPGGGSWEGAARAAGSQLGVQLLVGERSHREPKPSRVRRPWSPFPAETFHPLSVCLLPPTVCSVSGRVTGQMLFISSLRGLELGVSDR